MLYIAAFPCIPNCLEIMSQLITGDDLIKLGRNSFRVQLSVRGIAICFAPAQPKAQVSRGVACLCLCRPSKSKSKKVKQQPLWQFFWALASDCTQNRGLLVAQALLQVAAKLAPQANSLSCLNILWLTAHCFATQTGYYNSWRANLLHSSKQKP